MSHTVYGLCEHGSDEIRYVGQTVRPLAGRLFSHISKAGGLTWPDAFSVWLLEGEVEIFAIALCDGEDDALAKERENIAACIALGHRLFNIHHVPKWARIPRTTQWIAPPISMNALFDSVMG